MWKTRTKISKILTNIHAGFIAALLGCMLTSLPISSAMAATVTATACAVTNTYATTDAINCSGTKITLSSAAACGRDQTVNTCLRNTSTGATYYVSHCSCHLTSTTSQEITNTACGTITIAFPACESSGGDENLCAGVTCPNQTKTQTGYVITEKQACSSSTGSCVYSSHSAVCASGYSGTASCSRTKVGLSYIYSCSGCKKTCTAATEATACGSNTRDNGYTVEVLGKCISGVCESARVRSCYCKKNCYGNPTPNGSYSACEDLCEACPTDSKSGVAGETTSTGVGSAETRCYIPSGKPFTTDVGSGEYSSNCKY